jgi:hypothetical protein
MSLLLAGLTVLVIGDSHMTQSHLISTLHDDLMQQGARVYSYGACGTPAGAWMKTIQPPCGSAFRLDNGKIRERASEAASTRPLNQLLSEHHPDLIVVVNGDSMAAYRSAALPRTWIRDEVGTLTEGIKKSGVSCVWVGPPWGSEGGKFRKTYTRVKEMSDYLADIVAPCTYINSLKMSAPGEWKSNDGVHFMDDGYQAWGRAIVNEIVSSDTLEKIKH